MNSPSEPVSAPVAGRERIPLLDVLRGFALLGILLMNIEAFVGTLTSALTGLDPSLSGLDAWVDAAIYILVQGKFYTLFSLLFGAGFALILARAAARGTRVGWLYFRRTLVLLGFGWVHYMYVWSGDILLIYALTAFVLMLFGRTPASRLPKWGLAVYALPLVFTFLFAALAELSQLDPQAAAGFDEQMQQQARDMAQIDADQRAAYGAGSFAEANAQRRADFEWSAWYLPFFFMPIVLGLFLLGAWFVRSGVFVEPERHAGFFRRLRLAGFGLGLPLVLWSFWLMPTMDMARMDFTVALASATAQFGSLLLCLAYVSCVALGLQHPRWQGRLRLLAPAGRMALTNYLAQSLVCVGIFYGYGLGYFEQLPRAWQLPFVLLLYIAQVAFSHWWLQRFRFGPAEWLWRSLTYLRPQPMRRTADVVATVG